MKDILANSIRFVPVTLVMGTIFFLSHQPDTGLQFLPDIPGLDKLIHGIVYACLAAAALYALPQHQLAKRPMPYGVAVVVFCLVYGLSDEYHQSFIPGRDPSAGDLLADTVGAALMVYAWLRYNKSADTENLSA